MLSTYESQKLLEAEERSIKNEQVVYQLVETLKQQGILKESKKQK